MSFFNSSDDKTRNSLIMTTYYVNRVMLTCATVSSNTKYADNFCFEFKILSAVCFDNFKNISFLCKVLILAIAVRVIRLMTFKKYNTRIKICFLLCGKKLTALISLLIASHSNAGHLLCPFSFNALRLYTAPRIGSNNTRCFVTVFLAQFRQSNQLNQNRTERHFMPYIITAKQ